MSAGDMPHSDAFAVLQYLLSREIATVGADSPRTKLHDDFSLFHALTACA